MRVGKHHFRTIWLDELDPRIVQIIDQRNLPHEFNIEDLRTVDDMVTAIKDMHVRGAGLIGAAAGYGMYLAALHSGSFKSPYNHLLDAADLLTASRPTAVNLSWAINRQLKTLTHHHSYEQIVQSTKTMAQTIADEDARACFQIGQHGLPLIRDLSLLKTGAVVNILTHCNAGWLAFVDHGSATAPIYAAHDAHIKIHVWVDETRPRNQGARLTAWELEQHGVPYTVITDNAGGHLMQNGLVDLVIVGTDRTTYTGDVANKTGTYLKALAAHDNQVPFYVALPGSSFDWETADGVNDIPIEQRAGEEVKFIQGLSHQGLTSVLLTPSESPAINYAFDVTPARLVTGLITERGLCHADEESILALFPEGRA